MEIIRLTGRGSRLSLLQMEKVKQKIESAFPSVKAEVFVKHSRGDALQDIPLHTVEGSDFFTQDIFDALEKGEADIAVHSLKDMSSEHFFGSNRFAVVDRNDVRDVAIFREAVEEKISRGETLVIGTCSPRREEMAIGFLHKALPQLNSFSIETKSIRGNVDTRLRKLNAGEYDGIILATAGLNRLLESKEDAEVIRGLLASKKLMLLPLVECVPAPCQGAIVAEVHYNNKRAVEILDRINNPALYADCLAEKKEAIKYGAGCIQKFGVTTIHTKHGRHVYAAGRDSNEKEFVNWYPLPKIIADEEKIFSSSDYMKDFFNYEWIDSLTEIEQPVAFIANYKAIRSANEKEILHHKTIIASGTRTWLELAKQGFWVTASADGLGFEFLLPSLKMPLLEIETADICIITHEGAKDRWKQKGYAAMCNYKLAATYDSGLINKLAAADYIFWSSFSQYKSYNRYCKANAIHLCAGGETAALLKENGIEPVIFPTIKAFELWRKIFIRSHSAA
jgi:hydroxymethylbilane synthase